MATSSKRIPYLEKWDTRFGESERVVIRDENGKFIDNTSLTALRKGKSAPHSRKR